MVKLRPVFAYIMSETVQTRGCRGGKFARITSLTNIYVPVIRRQKTALLRAIFGVLSAAAPA
jgi:hypothetical protein